MMISENGNWKADRAVYGARAWLVQPSYWAVMTYRFGRWTRRAPRVVRAPAHALYFLAYSIVRLATGIDIPRGAEIGPGLMIHHFGGVIVNPEAKIGANCVLRHGVTIGSKYDGDSPPVIGNGVVVGAYAQILGNISVGDGAVIGAMSLVMCDVPKGAVAVGVPARVIGEARSAE